jgi:hypothetical protein
VAGVTEESALYDRHTAAAAAALGSFKRAAMGEPELVKEFEERLTKGELQDRGTHTYFLQAALAG